MAKRFTIVIKTSGAAFGENDPNQENHETARILRRMADRLETFGMLPVPTDANGNVVGEVSTFEED